MDEALRIALVGNGPAAGPAEPVDDHDLVVRFNSCAHYGRRGRRVDVLCIVNTGPPGARFADDPFAIDTAALAAANRFWLPKAPALVARYQRSSQEEQRRWTDHSTAIVERRMSGRPWEHLPSRVFDAAQEALRAHGATPESEPSTGMLVLFHVQQHYRRSKVTLFGFTHEGWRGHAWAAERSLIISWKDWVSYAPTSIGV